MFDAPQQPDAYIHEDAASSKFGAEIAGIIKFPPDGGKGGDVSYAQLTCSEQDMAFIYEIITTMAENGKISLLFKQGHLKQLGAQINHVHPLKFLSTIFKNPRLRSCMIEVSNDYFKWNGFMDGLGPSLTKEADKGKLDQYLKDFSADIEISPDNIRKYFQNRDWEGLVRYLMNAYD